MTPERNGVVAELLEYGCHVITDAYVLDGLLILRTSPERSYGPPPREGGPWVKVSRIARWFDERQAYGTLIARPGDWEGDFQ